MSMTAMPGPLKGEMVARFAGAERPHLLHRQVIVWRDLVERQRKELLNASLLGIYGIRQCGGEVRHLVAKRLVDLSHLLGRVGTSRRDFC
jgi:hypothetical protein